MPRRPKAQVQAGQARLGDLQHEINETRRRHDELRRREEAAQALLAAQQSGATARLALLQRDLDTKVTAHDRLLRRLEALERRGGELEAELAALAPPEPAPLAIVPVELVPDAAEPVALPAAGGASLRRDAAPAGAAGGMAQPDLPGRGLRQALGEQERSSQTGAGPSYPPPRAVQRLAQLPGMDREAMLGVEDAPCLLPLHRPGRRE